MREWTGLEFGKSQREVEKREEWRKLVVKSSLVPQQTPWFRDRVKGGRGGLPFYLLVAYDTGICCYAFI